EVCHLRKAHRQHAGSKRKIPRMPRRQICRISQRHQKVGASNCRCGHVAPPMCRECNHKSRQTGQQYGSATAPCSRQTWNNATAIRYVTWLTSRPGDPVHDAHCLVVRTQGEMEDDDSETWRHTV